MLGEIPPRFNIMQFSPLFSIFSRIFSDFRLSSFRLYLFVLSLDQELLTDSKFLRSGSYVILLRKYHNIAPIQKVRRGSCFFNKSRTNEDKKLGFSRLHTRDPAVWNRDVRDQKKILTGTGKKLPGPRPGLGPKKVGPAHI